MNKFFIVISLSFLLQPWVAQAYVDPGSGGAIITAVLGAIGAIGYTVRKYYYKIRRLSGRRQEGAEESQQESDDNAEQNEKSEQQ